MFYAKLCEPSTVSAIILLQKNTFTMKLNIGVAKGTKRSWLHQISSRCCLLVLREEVSQTKYGCWQSCNPASFWNPARAQNHKPNSARDGHWFLKPDLGSKVKFTKWVKICATAGYQKTECTDIAAGTRFYHTQNSNHLDQNIGLNKHKLSLLVHDNVTECNISQ